MTLKRLFIAAGLMIGTFTVPAQAAIPAGPDLIIDQQATASSVGVFTVTREGGSCAIADGVIPPGAPHTYVVFDTMVANIGDGDWRAGNADRNDPEHWFQSNCSGLWYLKNYARYQLVDANGVVVAERYKHGFCIMDSVKYLPDAGPAHHKSETAGGGNPDATDFAVCKNWGITAGWATIHASPHFDQWLLVDGVAPGVYTLVLTINPTGFLDESSLDNNTITVPVVIP